MRATSRTPFFEKISGLRPSASRKRKTKRKKLPRSFATQKKGQKQVD